MELQIEDMVENEEDEIYKENIGMFIEMQRLRLISLAV